MLDYEIMSSLQHDVSVSIDNFAEEFGGAGKKILVLGEMQKYIENQGMDSSWAMQSTMALLYAHVQDTVDHDFDKDLYNRLGFVIGECLKKGGYDPHS